MFSVRRQWLNSRHRLFYPSAVPPLKELFFGAASWCTVIHLYSKYHMGWPECLCSTLPPMMFHYFWWRGGFQLGITHCLDCDLFSMALNSQKGKDLGHCYCWACLQVLQEVLPCLWWQPEHTSMSFIECFSLFHHFIHVLVFYHFSMAFKFSTWAYIRIKELHLCSDFFKQLDHSKHFPLQVCIHPFAHIKTLVAVTNLQGFNCLSGAVTICESLAQHQEQFQVQYVPQGHKGTSLNICSTTWATATQWVANGRHQARGSLSFF